MHDYPQPESKKVKHELALEGAKKYVASNRVILKKMTGLSK